MELRILIIDDEKCIRDSLSIHLTDLGHEVYVSENPSFCSAANSNLCEQTYPCADILLIDQNMPTCKGLEFIREQSLLGCKLKPHHQIIMSGTVSPVMTQDAKELGCQIIQKPFSLAQLEQLIENLSTSINPNRQLSPVPESWGDRFSWEALH
jgi:DNA-binding NtrC family response regulator